MELYIYHRVFTIVRGVTLAYRINVGIIALVPPALEHLGTWATHALESLRNLLSKPVWKAVPGR
jgi:hypothetical protein